MFILTQYSYKVYVDKQPELCVFAKLSFEYALWNPDKTSHYDLQRTGEHIVCIVVSYDIFSYIHIYLTIYQFIFIHMMCK